MNLVSEYFGIQWHPNSCLPTLGKFSVSREITDKSEQLRTAIRHTRIKPLSTQR